MGREGDGPPATRLDRHLRVLAGRGGSGIGLPLTNPAGELTWRIANRAPFVIGREIQEAV